ncbi:MAG TPA: HAMP domain-containing sensor histidine kinase [Candidatus Cloacimonadota bacterium]|nr:HAMP domain-containing sensor histidine kinase [Candidatus Cloacimonadota bacterium]HQB40631.1 HAMP domain-containing sensor histidine kinase [Candidatus Cloacimonadota bacterium]
MEEAKTYYASPVRDVQEDIVQYNKWLKEQKNVVTLLEAVTAPILLLNNHMQAVYCNKAFFDLLEEYDEESVLGCRLGEIVNCENSKEAPSGCGTHHFCKYCPALATIMSGLEGVPDERDCRISTLVNEKYDFLELKVSSNPIDISDKKYVCLSVQDISKFKQQYMMEKIFIHDISNTATIIQITTDLLKSLVSDEQINNYIDNLYNVSLQLTDEIKSHREIILTENNELQTEQVKIDSSIDLMKIIASKYQLHKISKDKEIRIDEDSADMSFKSDTTIFKRVFGNMLKNALEAAVSGDIVRIGCNITEENRISFYTHNPQVMNEDIKANIFKKVYSTKGKNRGLGTYSIRILTENYLSGSATFESEPGKGTTFTITLPIGL